LPLVSQGCRRRDRTDQRSHLSESRWFAPERHAKQDRNLCGMPSRSVRAHASHL